jgi:hypothetical protein
MDVTAENLLNQVVQALFAKINKQELDPRFLENFIKDLVNKTAKNKTVIYKKNLQNIIITPIQWFLVA